MNTLLVAATCAFLVVAPFAASAGLRAAMLILAAIALALRPRAIGPLIRGTPRAVAACMAAWALLAALSLAWSEQPDYTLGELRAEILYGLLAMGVFFLAAAEDASRWRRWWIALLAGCAIFLAELLLQALAGHSFTRHTTLEQRGPWSTHLVLAAPLLLAFGWPPPWGVNRAPWVQAIALLVLLAAAWGTENRIMWVAFGAQLLLAMVLWRAIPAMEPTRERDLRRLAIAAVLVVAVAFAGALIERNERFFGAQAPVAMSFERDLRPRIWSTAIEQWRKAPWLGHGFGREIVAGAFIPLTPHVADHPELRHAHNMFLDAAIELGVVGLAVLVALLAALGREYRGYLRRADLAPLGVLGLMLVAGFVVKNLTDDFMHRHNALVFWALNGMLLGLGSAARRAGEGRD
jgi:O-antigen ligase